MLLVFFCVVSVQGILSSGRYPALRSDLPSSSDPHLLELKSAFKCIQIGICSEDSDLCVYSRNPSFPVPDWVLEDLKGAISGIPTKLLVSGLRELESPQEKNPSSSPKPYDAVTDIFFDEALVSYAYGKMNDEDLPRFANVFINRLGRFGEEALKASVSIVTTDLEGRRRIDGDDVPEDERGSPDMSKWWRKECDKKLKNAGKDKEMEYFCTKLYKRLGWSA